MTPNTAVIIIKPISQCPPSSVDKNTPPTAPVAPGSLRMGSPRGQQQIGPAEYTKDLGWEKIIYMYTVCVVREKYLDQHSIANPVQTLYIIPASTSTI